MIGADGRPKPFELCPNPYVYRRGLAAVRLAVTALLRYRQFCRDDRAAFKRECGAS